MQRIGKAGFALLALIAMMFALATPASAGVPIPCASERTIKVHDVGVGVSDGMTVYLGYKYTHCIRGAWIGYVDSTTYVPLRDEDAALALAQASGLSALPAPPWRLWHPRAFWVEWLWAALGLFGLAGSLSAPARRNQTEAGELTT